MYLKSTKVSSLQKHLCAAQANWARYKWHYYYHHQYYKSLLLLQFYNLAMERIACHAALAGRRLVTVQFSEQSLTRLYDGLPPFHSPIAPGSFPFIFVAPRVANAQQVDSAALCVQLHPHHHRSTYKQRCTTKHFTLKYLEKKITKFYNTECKYTYSTRTLELR